MLPASYLVECLGLPGAGKSRLCQELDRALRRSGQSATLHLRDPSAGLGRLATAGGLAAFTLHHPGQTRRSLLAIRAARPADPIWLAGTWLKRSALATRLRRAPGIHLIDAGVMQALWSLASRASERPLEDALDTLLREAPLPDLLLQLEVEPRRLRERLTRRPRPVSRLERQPGRNSDLLEHGGMLVGLVADRLAAYGPPRPQLLVLRNDDEGDLLRNIESVTALLAEPLTTPAAEAS